tara:strand:- start:12819 stop:12938 length:120 start_codon:yes stop_codon:yes gene_type:complete
MSYGSIYESKWWVNPQEDGWAAQSLNSGLSMILNIYNYE